MSMLDALDLSDPPKLLDVGTGAGIQAAEANRRGWSVVGIDVTQAMISEAAARSTGPSWIVAAAERLPFRGSSFDAVLMLGLIGYTTDPLQALREARACLPTGGYLVVSWQSWRAILNLVSNPVMPVSRRVQRTLDRLGLRQVREPQSAEPEPSRDFYERYNRFWKGEEFRDLLRAAAFNQLEDEVVDFGALRVFGHALWPERVDIAISVSLEALARRGPFRFLKGWATQHVALARAIPTRTRL